MSNFRSSMPKSAHLTQRTKRGTRLLSQGKKQDDKLVNVEIKSSDAQEKPMSTVVDSGRASNVSYKIKAT